MLSAQTSLSIVTSNINLGYQCDPAGVLDLFYGLKEKQRRA